MTFPWSGRGIFIIGYAVLGILGGLAAGHFLTPKFHADEVPFSMALAQIGLAAGMWLFSFTMGRTNVYASNEKETREPILRRERHTLLFMPGWLWALLATIFVAAPGAQSIASQAQAGMQPGAASGNVITMQTLQDLYAKVLKTLTQKAAVPSQLPEGASPMEDSKVTEIGPPESIALPEHHSLSPMRDWKDSKGRIMTATLERILTPDGGMVEFKRHDGLVFQVPLGRFCPEDQVIITRFALLGGASAR